MSVRSVVVRLEAEVSQYVAGMGRAAQSTDTVAGNIVRTRRTIADNEQAMKDMGGTFLKAGALTVAALGATAKAAMDWESAWTGVLKTVDGTPDQLKAVEDGLRGLARELPSSHTEIAAVAEAAGQLGIQTGNVVAFTKTMIDMGQSTNLSAEDAATSLARFSNVMGTNQKDVGKLGATLVGLGNNFATTESEIMAMSMRLSGAGKQIGISEGEVMGLAAAMSSVGIEAEAGGTAMSTIMKKISKASEEGGEDLSTLARISGMSSEQFSKAWKDDAAGALEAFVLGLDKAQQGGESVNNTLSDLGIKGIREADSLLRLSAAGSLMGEALKKGSSEYDKGTALMEEANKRYQTSASKVAIAWNKVKDSAIDAGAVLLPIITGVMESVGGLATAFGALPAPVQGTVTIMALASAGILLVGGGLLTLIPKIAATRVAMHTLSTSGSRVTGTMGKLAKGLGIAGAAIVAFQIANQVASREVEVSSEKMTAAIAGVSDSSKGLKSLDSVFAEFGSYFGKDLASDVNGVADAVSRVVNTEFGDGFQRGVDGLLGWTGLAKSETTTLDNRFKDLGVTMGQMVTSGNTEAAATAFRELSKEFEANGSNAADALAHLPGYENALLGLANEAGTATDKNTLLKMALGAIKDPAASAAATADLLTESLEQTGVTVGAVVEDMEKFLELLFETGMIVMSSRDAQFAYEASLRGVADQVKTITDSNGAMGATLNENATDFNMLTDAGKLANETFQGVAADGMARVEAMSKEGLGQDELQAKMAGTYEDLLVVADQFGFVGVEAEDLARKVLGVPDGVSVETWMDDRAKKMAEGTKAAVEAVDGTSATVTTRHVSLFEQYGTPYRDDLPSLTTTFDVPRKATGGPIYGPGTGTSDDVPIMASNGEHMFTAAEVQMMGGHDAVYRFRAGLHSGGVPAYAGGGAIGTRTSSRQLAPTRGGATVQISIGDLLAADLPGIKREVIDAIDKKYRNAGVTA